MSDPRRTPTCTEIQMCDAVDAAQRSIEDKWEGEQT